MEDARGGRAALLDAARDRLRRARAYRERAVTELRTADERVARARLVVADSERADREADEAEAAARIVAREWTAAGCPEGSRPSPDLLDRAARAARAADDARTLAEGARAALPGLTEEAGRVRSEAAAAVAVLAAGIEPRFAELARLRDAYEAALRPVAQLRHLVRHWGPAHPLCGFSSGVGAEIDARLRELAIAPPSEPDIVGGAYDLHAAARRLMEDPEAEV